MTTYNFWSDTNNLTNKKKKKKLSWFTLVHHMAQLTLEKKNCLTEVTQLRYCIKMRLT